MFIKCTKYIHATKAYLCKIFQTNVFMTWTFIITLLLWFPPGFDIFIPGFIARGCRVWSTGSDRSQSSVVNSMQEEPSEIAVVQISRSEYIMKCYHNMVDQIPQKRILRPWNQWESHCLYRRPHIWNSRTSVASRHQHTRELPLEQKLKIPLIDKPTCSSPNIYRMCRTRHFRWKGQCATKKSAFKHTTWSTTLSPSDDAALVQFD